MEIALEGITAALSIWNLLWVAFGVALGITVGAIPGMNAPMAMAIAIPLTFSMSPLAAIGMLVGVMKGGGFGGAIGAILLNTPGEPHSAATALDGHPLARQGKAKKALQTALFSSSFGDTCSDIVLILAAPPLAAVALLAGPLEFTAILCLSLSIIAALAGRSLILAVIAALVGAMIAGIGLDPDTATPRMTFGILEFYDGLPIIAVAIGMLAVPEIIIRFEEAHYNRKVEAVKDNKDPNDRLTWSEFWGLRGTLARGASIGTAIGATPGLGTTLAAFLSYTATHRISKNRDQMGRGALEGIAATESANSAVVGSNLIPLLTLGIPGNLTAALLVGAFLIHGLIPGPMIFARDGALVYGLFASMMMANAMVLLFGYFGLRFFARVIMVPGYIVFPTVLMLCVVGVFLSERDFVAIWVMIGFAVIGYLMRRTGISVVAFIIGLVLGPMIELSVRQSVILFGRNPIAILDHPFALIVFAMTPFALFFLIRDRRKVLAKDFIQEAKKN